MNNTIALPSAFGRSLMPSAFLFPKTKTLEHSHAQISTFFPLSSSLKIKLIILGLYEFSLLCLHVCPLVFKLCYFHLLCFKIFNASGISHLFYFSPQPLITDLTDVSILRLTEEAGMISTLSEFRTSENITMQNISENEIFF